MSEEQSITEELLPELEDTEDTQESPERSQAAFTIVVQSWATPILGIIMLIVGLLGGYYGRPLLETDQKSIALDDTPLTSTQSVPTPDANLAAQQQELMAMIVSETRHFQGDPNAPVTIIEFSDFK